MSTAEAFYLENKDSACLYQVSDTWLFNFIEFYLIKPVDQSNLGPEAASQEQIGLDQFGAGQFSQNELLAGMNQLQQPDMNQLLSQQQATLQVLGTGQTFSVI